MWNEYLRGRIMFACALVVKPFAAAVYSHESSSSSVTVIFSCKKLSNKQRSSKISEWQEENTEERADLN